MQNLGISRLQGFDKLRSLRRIETGTEKTPQITVVRPSLDSLSHGSFTNLKLTAEKLIKEQASVKTDLELANTKLKKATEQIHVLEAMLQDTINENAKLNVKHVEDAKLWNELDKKIYSTNSLCNQLSEALQKLAEQNTTADEDKKLIEERLLENTRIFDNLNLQFTDLSTKLQCAENEVNVGKNETCKLIEEKEASEKRFKDEISAAHELIKIKDSSIKDLEDADDQIKQQMQTLSSQLQAAQHELISKEEIIKHLELSMHELESEKKVLQCTKHDLKQQIENSLLEIKKLEEIIHNWMTKISQLDKDYLTISNNVVKLVSSFEKYCDLIQQEKKLTFKHNQGKLDRLQQQLVNSMKENSSFKLHNEQLNNRITEQQKAQEFVMVQHADECRLAEDKVRILESEVDGLLSRKNELEMMSTELEGRVKHLSEVAHDAEKKKQELSHTISKLELDNHDIQCNVQLQLKRKTEETEALHDKIKKYDEHSNLIGNQIDELRAILDEKEMLIASFKEREELLQEQKIEVQTSLAAAETKLSEAKKQYDMMFEGKQIELSKHLKDLSQKNDQAINEIKKKYESEKEDIVAQEKEKANKLVKEMEKNCEEKIKNNKEEVERYLMQVEEHKEMIFKIQQDCDQKVVNLHAHYREELQRTQLHADNEMREKTSSLRKEHEIQMKSLKMEYDDEHKKLHENLELQKSKEEKQRKLLQMQWKVMSENQQDNQEEYSTSSIKMRNAYRVKEHEIVLPTPESERQEMKISGYMQTPLANLLKKADDKKTVPKHHKVTRHEYEVETSNGQTIMKRRKTKSTVMFRNPTSHKTMCMRTPSSNKDIKKMTKITSGPQSHPANIGDLFSEGSLNPYADDPYAFG